MTDSMDMAQFEDAVHDWFAEATGLETVWRQQSAPQPELPFASIKVIAGPVRTGTPIVTETALPDPQPAGKEIEIKGIFPCSVTVSFQVFVGMPDARNPGYNARTYAVLAMTSLEMPEVRAVLWSKGISVLNVGAIQNLDVLVEAEHESRANIDVMFGIVLTREEFVGYIKTVHIESTSLGIDRDFVVGH
jgi:hypothetical protein